MSARTHLPGKFPVWRTFPAPLRSYRISSRTGWSTVIGEGTMTRHPHPRSKPHHAAPGVGPDVRRLTCRHPRAVTLSAAKDPRVQWSAAERERNRPQVDVEYPLDGVHLQWTGFAGGRFHFPTREVVRGWVFAALNMTGWFGRPNTTSGDLVPVTSQPANPVFCGISGQLPQQLRIKQSPSFRAESIK
jgi:hypothetical protein